MQRKNGTCASFIVSAVAVEPIPINVLVSWGFALGYSAPDIRAEMLRMKEEGRVVIEESDDYSVSWLRESPLLHPSKNRAG